MPTRPLPNDPPLEHLRKEAKRLAQRVRAGDAAAIAQAREFHPRAAEAIPQFSLTDAQLAIARQYGFVSWPKLKAHLTAIKAFSWHTPPAQSGAAPLDEVFVRLACLVYGAWHGSDVAKAERLLRENPAVASITIYTAAAAGDVDAVLAAIRHDPALINATGGPLNWPPLLYACYSRLEDAPPKRSSLDVARVLLEGGADPNAGFMWNGTYPFTALTGAFGRGEDNMNELPHPRCDALARLLLDAGADPNDTQTLYNRHFEANDDHLRLLFSYGLGAIVRDAPFHSTPIGWARYGQHEDVVSYLARFATVFDAVRCDAVARVAELLRQDPSLANALDEDGDPLVFYLHPEMSRLEDIIGLLTTHGVNLDAPNREGQTLLDLAVARGWIDFADVLRAHGAGTQKKPHT